MVVENGKEWKLVRRVKYDPYLYGEVWIYDDGKRKYALNYAYVKKSKKAYLSGAITVASKKKLHLFYSKEGLYKFLKKRKLPSINMPF